MKKLLAVVLVCLLAFSCSVTAFAVATPDESQDQMIGFEVMSVPKTEYSFMNDVSFNLSDEQLDVLFESEDLDYIESVLLSSLEFNIDLEGAVLYAYYQDNDNGESALVIEPEYCTATVLDMPTSFDDSEVFRDYIVEVEYNGFKDTYQISLYDDSEFDPGESDEYKFISYTPPEKTTYVFEDSDAYSAADLYPGFEGWFIDVDNTGMTATVLNKTTGKLEVYDADSIYCDPLYIDPMFAQIKEYKNVNAFAVIITDSGKIVPFTYTLDVISQEIKLGEPPTVAEEGEPTTNTDTKESMSTADTPAKEEMKNNNQTITGNKTVNTGDVFPAVIVLVVMSSMALALMFISRKKSKK